MKYIILLVHSVYEKGQSELGNSLGKILIIVLFFFEVWDKVENWGSAQRTADWGCEAADLPYRCSHISKSNSLNLL